MKVLSLCVILLSMVATSVFAETRYVTDVFEVMVRTGPNLTNKIIAMPKSGAPLEIIERPNVESEDEWVKVRLASGKEGWMLSQYLIDGPPKSMIIARFEKENGILKARNKKLSEESAELKKNRKELESALTTQTKTGNSLREAYETLKQGSKEYLTLKASYDEASRELEAKKKQVSELENEVEGLRGSQTLRWFIAGATIISIGFIIGFISRRPKRRPSLL